MGNLFPRLKEELVDAGFKKLTKRAITSQFLLTSYLFDEEESGICADLIAKKLLLRRRHYIQKVPLADLREFYSVKGLKKLVNFFLPKR